MRKRTGHHLLRHPLSEAVRAAAAAVLGADATLAGLTILQFRCVHACVCGFGMVTVCQGNNAAISTTVGPGPPVYSTVLD